MAIVFGTGKYALKKFTAQELGIFSADGDQYTYMILQKYFHLYWIPLFPTGVAYTIKKRDTKDHYVAGSDLENLMRAHYRVPFWKRFGAWAIPLIGLLIWGFMNISDNIRQKQYDDERSAMMVENKKAALDTASYRIYADKYKGIEALIAQNFHDYPNKIMPIDTHSTKLLRMYLGLFLEKKDTSIVFNTENTFFYVPQIVSQDIQEISQNNQNWDQWRNFQNKGCDNSILSWYKNNMKSDEDITTRSNFVDNIKTTNEKIDKIRYIAVARIVGFVRPSMLGESRFSSGYVKENIYIYDVNTKKLLQKRTIIGKNTNEISTHNYQNSSQNESEISLLHNLRIATNKEIIDNITNQKKKEDDLPF